MKNLLLLLTTAILISACVKEPRLSFGKKCTVKDDKIIYSYLWVYEKSNGLPADAITCELIDKSE